MSTLLISVPAGGDRAPFMLSIRSGETARFGRGVAEHPVDVVLADPAVPRIAGEILAVDSYWLLSNLGGELSLLVENPEGAGEYVRVAPRRLFAPIPFEFSRVVLATRSGVASFQVYAPCHSYVDPHAAAAGRGASTVHPFSLNEEATYFLVLVALCEPRLRDLSNSAVPTTPQIVERLGRHPDHRQITASAVGFHLNYLADTKLRIKPPEQTGRQGSKRDVLVSVALRFGLVAERHLALLPPPAPSSVRSGAGSVAR